MNERERKLFFRILEQAEKALKDEPVEALKDVPLGMYGLNHVAVRLGNIVATCKTALYDDPVEEEKVR